MINLTYNDREINQREADGYVNAAQMCQANKKKINDWTRLKETKAYINGISRTTGIPAVELVQSKDGSPEFGGGTWIHPKLAICLGRWISVDFAIWCDEHIKTIMENGTMIASQPQLPQTYLQALEALVIAEKAKALLKAEKELLEKENQQLAEAVDELFNYSSIIRVAKFNNVSEKNFSWRRLKVISDEMRIEIKRVPCPRFESKNLYSHDVWRVAYPGVKLPETICLRQANANALVLC